MSCRDEEPPEDDEELPLEPPSDPEEDPPDREDPAADEDASVPSDAADSFSADRLGFGDLFSSREEDGSSDCSSLSPS